MAVSRREFLQIGVAGTAILSVPACGAEEMIFFEPMQRRLAERFANVVWPADASAGGAELGCVRYIENLLTAFDHTPPRLFAGGPYGEDFASFLPLDRMQEAAWRLRIFGSAGLSGGRPSEAVLGPVVGLRDRLTNGLNQALTDDPTWEKLDDAGIAALYDSLPKEFRSDFSALVLEGVIADPIYGGNKDKQGWALAHFEGPSQPGGYATFDVALGKLVERPESPLSTPNPGPDPDPLAGEPLELTQTLVEFAGGKKFY